MDPPEAPGRTTSEGPRDPALARAARLRPPAASPAGSPIGDGRPRRHPARSLALTPSPVSHRARPSPGPGLRQPRGRNLGGRGTVAGKTLRPRLFRSGPPTSGRGRFHFRTAGGGGPLGLSLPMTAGQTLLAANRAEGGVRSYLGSAPRPFLPRERLEGGATGPSYCLWDKVETSAWNGRALQKMQR